MNADTRAESRDAHLSYALPDDLPAVLVAPRHTHGRRTIRLPLADPPADR